MKLSLVIPCFNEVKSLPSLIDQCEKLIERGDVEVILVDNGSTDKSSLILKKLLGKKKD